MIWLNEPRGDIDDRQAKIFPFKLHLARQIADAENEHLVLPNLWGGFWKHFHWGKNAPPAASATMKELYRAMGTADRRPSGMDFEQLGYKGDPAIEGGRFKTLPKSSLGESRN